MSGQTPWGTPNQPWGDPNRGAPGQQAHPWSGASPWGGHGPPPPKKSSNTGLIVGIVLAVIVLPVVGLAVAGVLVWRRAAGAMANLEPIEPEEAPRILKQNLPCKDRCKFHTIAVGENWLYVTVESEEVAGRTLTYRVYRNTAEIATSSDIRNSGAPLDIDVIEWPLVNKVRRELEAVAAGGRTVDTVLIRACTWGDKGAKAHPCMEASVLTAKGEEKRFIDASTGQTR